MNSLVQQFYMMPEIRNGILAADIDFAETPKEDNLLYQLQVLFSFLTKSEKQAYDTVPFCFSYKDYSVSTNAFANSHNAGKSC